MSWAFAETEGDAELGRGPGAASGLERGGGRVRWEQRCVRPAVVLDPCVAHHRSMSTPTFIAVLDISVSATDRARKIVTSGKRVTVRAELECRHLIKKKQNHK